MRSTQQFSITLPNEMAEEIEKKVESGAYASVSEVVREGIRTLLDRDVALEKWLRTEVVKSLEEYEADPSSGIPADQILARIGTRTARDVKKSRSG
jgi:antitoxin ParD1/3/4